MAGGKGGSTTTSVEIPEYIQEAAKRNLTKAERISQLGYVPYYGPDVAAFTPLQEAAFGNVAGQAGAFGLTTPAGGAMSGMPAAQEFAGGVRGYSSAPMFEQAQAELAARRPAQKSYIDSFFIDPFSGEYGSNVAAPIDYTTAFPQAPVVTGDTGGGGGGGTGGGISTGVVSSVQDVLDAYDTLPPEILPPIVPAVGGGDPNVGDIIYNEDLKDIQNQVIVDAFNQYGDILNDPNLTPAQKAAANPAFNPEIALANQDVQVTIDTPTGSYTKAAGDLTSEDFAAATGATYTPAETAGGLGTFTGGGTGINTSDLTGQTVPYSDVADLAEQYSLAGQSATSAGIRNIGGSYAQSPAGSGDLVETRYNPATGLSEVIGVVPTEDYSFMGDLQRSLTDPSYDPEGTVLSRFLDSLASATPSAGPLPPVYDPTANESNAARAREEARITQNLQQMVTNPEAVLAQYDKADRTDVANQIKQAQTLSAAPRPPSTGNKYEAQAWIKENMGISVDKNDAMDWLAGFQTDWDRLNK